MQEEGSRPQAHWAATPSVGLCPDDCKCHEHIEFSAPESAPVPEIPPSV